MRAAEWSSEKKALLLSKENCLGSGVAVVFQGKISDLEEWKWSSRDTSQKYTYECICLFWCTAFMASCSPYWMFGKLFSQQQVTLKKKIST